MDKEQNHLDPERIMRYAVFSIRNSLENLFVSMPSYKTKQVNENSKDIYKDICFPVTKEFRERLNNAVLTSFKEHKLVMIDTTRGRDQVMSDAVKAAMEDMGELPFEEGAILRSRIQDGSDEMAEYVNKEKSNKTKARQEPVLA